MSNNTPPLSNWRLRLSFFLRAIGVKKGFRRTGPSTLLNIFVAAGVGVISGRYIFKDPIDDYWGQKKLAQQSAQQSQSRSSSSPAATPKQP